METYAQQQEANYCESVAERFIRFLENEVGVPNAFGSEELKEEMEELMDDDSWEEEDEIPDGTEELSYSHE
jgi:hypothetical protein